MSNLSELAKLWEEINELSLKKADLEGELYCIDREIERASRKACDIQMKMINEGESK